MVDGWRTRRKGARTPQGEGDGLGGELSAQRLGERLWRLNGLLRARGMCGEGARERHRWMVGIDGGCMVDGWRMRRTGLGCPRTRR